MRDRALLDLAIDSKLRGCDLVKIKIGTLVAGPKIRARSMVVQQKTGRPVQFEITSDARASLLAWLERRSGTVDDFAFPSRVDAAAHLSTRQYARLVEEWVSAIGLRPEQSMARTRFAHQTLDHLQGDGQSPCGPDPQHDTGLTTSGCTRLVGRDRQSAPSLPSRSALLFPESRHRRSLIWVL